MAVTANQAVVPPDFDPSVLEEILPDSPDFQAETLQDYLDLLNDALPKLDQTLQSKSPSDVVSISHRLKGASQSVGALAMAALCQEIEAAGRANDGTRFSVFREQLPAREQALQKVVRDLNSQI